MPIIIILIKFDLLSLNKIFNYLFHWWTTASEEATTPIVLLAIFFTGGGGTALLDKKKANAPTPSKIRTAGITIAIIPPVDNPPDFFLNASFSGNIVEFSPSWKSIMKILSWVVILAIA